jgi:hypothetical protein
MQSWEAVVAPSELIDTGQPIEVVAAKVAEGAPLVRCQLLASDFYEAWKRELRASMDDFDKRELLIAAGVHCCRMRTAAISPGRMLEELTSAVHVLRSQHLLQPPSKPRPVLRVIEGGLSRRLTA